MIDKVPQEPLKLMDMPGNFFWSLKGEGQLKCLQISNSSSKYIIYQIFSVQKAPEASKLVFEMTSNPLR